MPDNRPALTPRQGGIYQFILAEIYRKGRPPTMQEIADEFGLESKNGVAGHLRLLEQKGYIRRDRLTARGIEIVGQHDELLAVLKRAHKVFEKVATENPGWLPLRDAINGQIKKLEKSRRA